MSPMNVIDNSISARGMKMMPRPTSLVHATQQKRRTIVSSITQRRLIPPESLTSETNANYSDYQPQKQVSNEAKSMSSRVSLRKPRVVSARPQIKQMARLVQEREIKKNDVPKWKQQSEIVRRGFSSSNVGRMVHSYKRIQSVPKI